jgi:hypothetical protein
MFTIKKPLMIIICYEFKFNLTRKLTQLRKNDSNQKIMLTSLLIALIKAINRIVIFIKDLKLLLILFTNLANLLKSFNKFNLKMNLNELIKKIVTKALDK